MGRVSVGRGPFLDAYVAFRVALGVRDGLHFLALYVLVVFPRGRLGCLGLTGATTNREPQARCMVTEVYQWEWIRGGQGVNGLVLIVSA